MRMRKKPNLAARLEKCGHLLLNNPAALRGRWLEEFPQYTGLRLELGCGKGRFTAETAKSERGVLIAALEKSADAMIIALERAAAENLNNIRFINALAGELTEFFAEGEVSRIYICFCDPWPANRHAKRRLTAPDYIELYKRILSPGGEIHFKTDNSSLFDFSLREFERSGFILCEVTRDLHGGNTPVGVMTDYEAKFHAQGIPISRCIARLG